MRGTDGIALRGQSRHGQRTEQECSELASTGCVRFDQLVKM